MYKLPFADFGAMLDPPTEDVTAHVIEMLAAVGCDAGDVDAPVAGAFAGGLVGEALRRLENKDGGTLSCELLGDGPRDGAANLFVGIEQEDDLALQKIGLSEHFDGSEGHGDAGMARRDPMGQTVSR